MNSEDQNNPPEPIRRPHRKASFYPPGSREDSPPLPVKPLQEKLDYETGNKWRHTTDERLPSQRYENVGFVAGLILGVIVSSAAYFSGNDHGRNIDRDNYVILASVVIGLAKLIASPILIKFRRTKHVGLGILVSLPIGLLLFMIECGWFHSEHVPGG